MRALVTGASSGIGRATAHRLAAQGWDLHLLSRSEQALTDTAQECLATSAAQVSVHPCDVRDAAAVGAVVASLPELDVVVHSAAALAYGHFEDVPAEVFDASVRTTLHGTTHVARAALDTFARHGDRGHLVLVGSLLGEVPIPTMSSYCAPKWGLHGLARCLQVETRSSPDVRVSLVAPGAVRTPVYHQAGTYIGRHGRPAPPVAAPDRVAAAVLAVIARPRRLRRVGAMTTVAAHGHRWAPSVFDALVTPLFDSFGLEPSVDQRRNGPGNVLHQRPEDEAVERAYPAPGLTQLHRLLMRGRG